MIHSGLELFKLSISAFICAPSVLKSQLWAYD